MEGPSAPLPPVRPSGTLKPPPQLKRLDDALMAILRRRKSEAGIMPGVPLN
jgi:hypothetical protein